jgi:transcriptional regulator with GAF, ATPase, and Fis domain
LIGRHPAFLRTGAIPLMATTDGPTLISGETDTGKELCARAIHHLSSRRHLPFVPVDCADPGATLRERDVRPRAGRNAAKLQR